MSVSTVHAALVFLLNSWLSRSPAGLPSVGCICCLDEKFMKPQQKGQNVQEEQTESELLRSFCCALEPGRCVGVAGCHVHAAPCTVSACCSCRGDTKAHLFTSLRTDTFLVKDLILDFQLRLRVSLFSTSAP